jgi:hypothetical protein
MTVGTRQKRANESPPGDVEPPHVDKKAKHNVEEEDTLEVPKLKKEDELVSEDGKNDM